MSNGRARVWFVVSRFERLRDLLAEHGFAIDPGARDPNEWDEQHWEDPPTGLVRLKGVRLADLEDDDSDFDPEITFTLEELWSSEQLDQAQAERGYFLVEYSYHAHFHGVDQRWDFDPAGHPEIPYHHHPPSTRDQRVPQHGFITPEDALGAFAEWVRAGARPEP